MRSAFERAVTCNLCWQLFATGPRAPLVLPKCGDTFCRACLRKVQPQTAWMCPLCAHAYTEISVPDLPVNFLALVVTSVLKESFHEKIQPESKGSSDHFHRSLNRIRKELCSVIDRLESPKVFQFSVEQVSFSNDDTSGSGSSSASASALASVRIGETKSAADSVSLAYSVRDEGTAAKPESSVSNILAQLPFSWLQIKKSTASNGQCNGSTQETGCLSNGIMFASGLTSLPPKTDLRDSSQDPKPLENNESNSPSRSLPNDTNANVDVNEMKSLTTSKSTSESSEVDSSSSAVKESTQENSFSVCRISTLQIKDEANYHQKVPSEEFGLTNASASASASTASTSSSSLETSAPRSTSTPSDSSSKTAAANKVIPSADPIDNYSRSMKPKDGSGNHFKPTPMDPKKAIMTIFGKLNSEKGYYEEITSKGFLGREPSVHVMRKTVWRRQGKCHGSKSNTSHSVTSPKFDAEKNLDLQCQSRNTSLFGLGARPKTGLASLPTKADLKDSSQDPKPLESNEANSPSVRYEVIAAKVESSVSKNTFGQPSLSKGDTSESRSSSPSGALPLFRIGEPKSATDSAFQTNSVTDEVSAIPESSVSKNKFEQLPLQLPSEDFGLTNASDSGSASSASTSSSSLETSAPRSTSTPGDSSSKTAAANKVIPSADPIDNYSRSMKPKDGSGNRFRPTAIDPKMAIMTTFEKLNSEKGYYEEITSKGFLGREPSVHVIRKTIWRRQGKCHGRAPHLIP